MPEMRKRPLMARGPFATTNTGEHRLKMPRPPRTHMNVCWLKRWSRGMATNSSTLKVTTSLNDTEPALCRRTSSLYTRTVSLLAGIPSTNLRPMPEASWLRILRATYPAAHLAAVTRSSSMRRRIL